MIRKRKKMPAFKKRTGELCQFSCRPCIAKCPELPAQGSSNHVQVRGRDRWKTVQAVC